MLAAARRANLLRYVQDAGTADVTSAAVHFSVSASTIRRDLELLRSRGLLQRVHGGAMTWSGHEEAARRDRARDNTTEKDRIAEAACRLITERSTVLITGGTTTEMMLPHLDVGPGLTIVTNSLPIAVRLRNANLADLIILGGSIRRREDSFLGQMTCDNVARLNIDVVFSGAFGIDCDGVSGADSVESETDRFLMTCGRKLILLADSSKLGRRGPINLVGLHKISALISGRVTDAALLNAAGRQRLKIYEVEASTHRLPALRDRHTSPFVVST